MTTPATSQIPPQPVLPDWNVLPTHIACPFLFRPTVRKIAGYTTIIASVATTIGHRWASHNLRATPIVIINSLRALVVLTGAFAVSSVAAFLLPASIKDENERLRLRRAAGADILRGNELLPYPEIALRHNTLFLQEILVNADIDALINQEIPRLNFFDFNIKHTTSVLERVSDGTKKRLVEKFTATELPAQSTFKSLTQNNLINALKISPETVAIKMCATPAIAKRLMADDYSYTQFVQEHGEDVLDYLPPDIKQKIIQKFSVFAIGQKLTLNQAQEKYGQFCVDHFDQKVYQDLMGEVLKTQALEMSEGRVTNYADFRQNNGVAWFKDQLKNNAPFRDEAKKCFLDSKKTPYTVQLSNTYAEDRRLFVVEIEQCIEAVNEWIENSKITYMEYKKIHGTAHLDKLKPEIQERFKKEISAYLVENPEAMRRFDTEMKFCEVTSDEIYLQRWKGMKLDIIIQKDGPYFFTLISAPKNIKEHILKEIGNRSVKELILKYPRLFKELLAPADRVGDPEKSLTDKIEAAIKDYRQLAEIAEAFGPEFYSSGYVSESFLVKMVSYYLGAASIAERIIYDPERLDIKPLPIEIEQAISSAREKVKVARELAEMDSNALKFKHSAALKSLEESYTTKIAACEERKAFHVAEEADKPNQTHLSEVTKTCEQLSVREQRLQSEFDTAKNGLVSLRRLHGNVNCTKDIENLSEIEKELGEIKVKLHEQDLADLKKALLKSSEHIQLLTFNKEIPDLEARITSLENTVVQGKEPAVKALKEIDALKSSLTYKKNEQAVLLEQFPRSSGETLATVQQVQMQLEERIAQLIDEQKPLLARQKELGLVAGNINRKLDGPLSLERAEKALPLKQQELSRAQIAVTEAHTHLAEVKAKAETSAKAVASAKEKYDALEKGEKERVAKEKKTLNDELDKALKAIEAAKKATSDAAYNQFLGVLSVFVNRSLKEDLSQPDYNWKSFRETHSTPILHIVNQENKDLLKAMFMARDFEGTGTLLGSEHHEWAKGLGIDKLMLARKLFATKSHMERISREVYTLAFFNREYGPDCLDLLPADLKKCLRGKPGL